MSTTPPTEQCEPCKGTGIIANLKTINGDVRMIPGECHFCHGTGVVAAEAENMADRLQRDSSRDILAEEIIKHEPDVEKIKQITGFAPTAGAEKPNPYTFSDIYPDKDLTDYNAEEAYEMGVSAGWGHLAPTPPAATDAPNQYYSVTDVHQTADGTIARLTPEAAASIEAHYSARFERAIGHAPFRRKADGQKLTKPELVNLGRTHMADEARSRYYGDQAGGSDE